VNRLAAVAMVGAWSNLDGTRQRILALVEAATSRPASARRSDAASLE